MGGIYSSAVVPHDFMTHPWERSSSGPMYGLGLCDLHTPKNRGQFALRAGGHRGRL